MGFPQFSNFTTASVASYVPGAETAYDAATAVYNVATGTAAGVAGTLYAVNLKIADAEAWQRKAIIIVQGGILGFGVLALARPYTPWGTLAPLNFISCAATGFLATYNPNFVTFIQTAIYGVTSNRS